MDVFDFPRWLTLIQPVAVVPFRAQDPKQKPTRETSLSKRSSTALRACHFRRNADARNSEAVGVQARIHGSNAQRRHFRFGKTILYPPALLERMAKVVLSFRVQHIKVSLSVSHHDVPSPDPLILARLTYLTYTCNRAYTL